MIAYNLKKLDTLDGVAAALLDLDDAKKEILEELKNSDCTLPKTVYNEMCQNIDKVFKQIQQPFLLRSAMLTSEKIAAEKAAAKANTIRVTKKQAIKNKYAIKLLKYENSLYKKECRAEYRANKLALQKEPP